MVPYKNHTTLGNSCSCAEVIDVFSWSEGLTLIGIRKRGSEKNEERLEHAQTAGRQSVVDEQDKDLGFADSFYV
jgi:hypothetical protein